MATDQKQDIDLGLTREDMGETRRAVLTLETGKHYNGGVGSDATVFWIGDHSKQHAFGLGCGGDFSKKLHVNKAAKATQRNIDKQHAEVFTAETVATLTQAAKEHYQTGADKRGPR